MRHGFVRRNTSVGNHAGKLVQQRNDCRHPCRTANQQYSIEIRPLQPARLQCLPCGESGTVEQVLGDLLKTVARNIQTNCLAFVIAGNRSLGPGGEGPLGVFAIAPDATMCIGVVTRVDAMLPNKLFRHEINQTLIPIATAQLHVAISGQGNEVLAANSHHGDIKCPASQIVNQDVLRFMVLAIGRHQPALKTE